MNRRSLLKFLGLAPVAAVTPKSDRMVMAHPTGIPFADPPDPPAVVVDTIDRETILPMRFLGIAQLKNEGQPVDD